jgi:hypothetical protein
VSIDTSPKSVILVATSSSKQVFRGMKRPIHSISWKVHSPKSISSILHGSVPIKLEDGLFSGPWLIALTQLQGIGVINEDSRRREFPGGDTGMSHSLLSGWWGWVAENGSRIAWCAHPREKSAPGLVNAGIYRLVKETLRKIVRTRD